MVSNFFWPAPASAPASASASWKHSLSWKLRLIVSWFRGDGLLSGGGLWSPPGVRVKTHWMIEDRDNHVLFKNFNLAWRQKIHPQTSQLSPIPPLSCSEPCAKKLCTEVSQKLPQMPRTWSGTTQILSEPKTHSEDLSRSLPPLHQQNLVSSAQFQFTSSPRR